MPAVPDGVGAVRPASDVAWDVPRGGGTSFGTWVCAVALGHAVASLWLLLLYLSPWLGRREGVPWVWLREWVESMAAGYGCWMRGTVAA